MGWQDFIPEPWRSILKRGEALLKRAKRIPDADDLNRQIGQMIEEKFGPPYHPKSNPSGKYLKDTVHLGDGRTLRLIYTHDRAEAPVEDEPETPPLGA